MSVTAPATEAPHALLDRLQPDEARQALGRCCGATAWIEGMLARRPFASQAALYAAAEAVWQALGPEDYLEAFAHHPQIGGRAGDTSGWAAAEQARVGEAASDVVTSLAAANRAYLARFGYIFIVCATGKTADEMLALLRDRLGNDPGAELPIAAAEQAKITRLRLEKLTR
ncbi:MAG TPA: 2-oxo-4-hydroxy-4-carboxy-5-ureidoimidazoline decarboxylase [Polyangia bacterium]